MNLRDAKRLYKQRMYMVKSDFSEVYGVIINGILHEAPTEKGFVEGNYPLRASRYVSANFRPRFSFI